MASNKTGLNMKKYSIFLILLLNSPIALASETSTETSSDDPSLGEDIKNTSGKVWDSTKEVSGKAWEATKEGSSNAWDSTKQFSNETWEKTKDAVSD